jgi:drug/metabolite transporter (DMT)-like permease
MPATAYIALTVFSAIVYSMAAVAFKAATARGARAAPLAVVLLFAHALAFLFVAGRRDGPPWPDPFWPAPVAGLLFTLGQFFTLLAISRCDVSIATPILNTKVVWVAAVLALLARQPVGTRTWLAAVVTVGGIALLNATGRRRDVSRLARTIALSTLAAVAFAAFDVMIQIQSARLGYGRLAPAAMFFAALFSLGLLAMPREEPAAPLSMAGRAFAAAGVALMTFQAVLFITAIGRSGHAAVLNVVYSTRAVWSLLLVLAFGRLIGNRELHAARRVVACRFAGALLIVAAVAIVLR